MTSSHLLLYALITHDRAQAAAENLQHQSET
jgi:hypothetical protein